MALSCLLFSKGPTLASFFESFIEQLLQYCGRWPEPESILVMDNASFITQAESIALMQESSYCTYHPTHETSTLLKSFSFSFFFRTEGLHQERPEYEEDPDQGFHSFLRRCLNDVGAG